MVVRLHVLGIESLSLDGRSKEYLITSHNWQAGQAVADGRSDGGGGRTRLYHLKAKQVQ